MVKYDLSWKKKSEEIKQKEKEEKKLSSYCEETAPCQLLKWSHSKNTTNQESL